MTMEMIEKWKSALMKPKETFAAEKKNANIMAGVKNFAIGFLIAGLLTGITAFIASPVAGVVGIIVAPIAMIIFGTIGMLIGTGVLHLIAILLGGKGKYAELFYLQSGYYPPIVIAGSIPFIGPLLGLILGLYGLYLMTLAIKEVHAFSTGKAILTWLLPAIIIGIAVAVLAVALFATIMGAVGLGTLGGAAGALGPAGPGSAYQYPPFGN